MHIDTYCICVVLNSLLRISGIGSALKKAAPLITEKFQLGVEAQFARMLFAVVALFYVSWTALVVSLCTYSFPLKYLLWEQNTL